MRHNKRLTALALAGLMGVMTLAPAGTAYADDAWKKVDGAYKMIDGTEIDGVVARGIDVSHWQGEIDWAAVAADDIQFVMLGTRYKGALDPKFQYNIKEAYKHGIKVGVYIYSYATTPEMALAEADYILDLIKDYPISYPVAFDLEDKTQIPLTKDQKHELIDTFCGRIAEAGYHPMVYANDYWLANYVDPSRIKYDIWVARYQVKHTFSNPAIWQATATGRVNGIKGNVDIDFQYKDFSNVIPANTWRTIAGNTYYYQDFLMQKSSWINDGKGWFYMNDAGNPSKGWLDQSGTHYYLDETSGKMTTGWKAFDDKWYYFADSGKMATGWATVGNSKYYMNQDGVMQTGWLDNNNQKFYLQNDGSAATGWQLLDGSHYYFNGGGDMARGWVNADNSWYYMNTDGKMATEWYTDQTGTYYLSTSSGKMTTGWRQVGDAWYYFNGSGQMQKGMINVDNASYYLNPADGKMLANTTITQDGVDYQINGSGVMTKVEPPAEETTASTGETSGSTSESTSGTTDGSTQDDAHVVPVGPGV